MKLADLDCITLIKEDFDVILSEEEYNNTEYSINKRKRDFDKQYTENKDCMIARALIRLGFKNFEVFPREIEVTEVDKSISRRCIWGGLNELLKASNHFYEGGNEYRIEFKV